MQRLGDLPNSASTPRVERSLGAQVGAPGAVTGARGLFAIEVAYVLAYVSFED